MSFHFSGKKKEEGHQYFPNISSIALSGQSLWTPHTLWKVASLLTLSEIFSIDSI